MGDAKWFPASRIIRLAVVLILQGLLWPGLSGTLRVLLILKGAALIWLRFDTKHGVRWKRQNDQSP